MQMINLKELTNPQKIQKLMALRYRQENPEITLVHDFGRAFKTGKRVLASEIFNYCKNSDETGFYTSVNNSFDTTPEETRDEKGWKVINSGNFSKFLYSIFIDKDTGDNPFLNSPLTLSSIERRTGAPGWHGEIFIEKIEATTENIKKYKKVINMVNQFFDSDDIKDIGRNLRLPYTRHSKKGREHEYYELIHLSENYYTLDELEELFYNPDLEIYKFFTKNQKKLNEGQRHAGLLYLANCFYGNGMARENLLHYIKKADQDFCNPPNKYDSTHLEKIILDAVYYIDNNGGPKNILDDIKDLPLFRLDQGGFIERLKYYLSEGEIIYNINNQSWYRFKDKYWIDNRMPLYSLITEIIEKYMKKEKDLALFNLENKLIAEKTDPKEKEKALKNLEKTYNTEIKNAHSTYYKDAIMKQLAEQEGFAATEEINSLDLPVFNQVHHKFNFANGAFNFNTRQLEPNNWNDYSTVMTPYNYYPDAKSPKFDEFLKVVLDQGDFNGPKTQGLIEWMQLFLGSCLIGGENRSKVFPVWFGSGDNGKSTFVDIISTIFNEYAGSIRAKALTSKADGNRFELSDVPNKRFLIANESKEGDFLDVALVKAMTGNDLMKCERKGVGHFDFKPSFKMILLTNNKPVIREKTDAIWGRVKLIPFIRKITEEEKKPNIKEEILAEAPGVVNWLVEGAIKWIEADYKLPETESIKEATKEYRISEDIMQNWIDEACEITDSTKSGSTVKDLFHSFGEDTGSKMGRQNFTKELEKMGYIKEKYQSYHFNLKLIHKPYDNNSENYSNNSKTNEKDDINFDDVPF